METEEVIDVFREGIMLTIRVGGPILLMCMAVGVVVAILQAVTQIHEQSIAFILKLIVVVLFLSLGGSWMIHSLQEYAMSLFRMIM